MVMLTPRTRELLNRRNFAFFATVMEDGSPHVSPVWVDVDDTHVLVNSAEGRVKTENCKRDPRVALSVADQDDPYQHVDIRGRVVDIATGPEAEEHIHFLQRKYHPQGPERYPLRPGERRVLFRIEPDVIFESS